MNIIVKITLCVTAGSMFPAMTCNAQPTITYSGMPEIGVELIAGSSLECINVLQAFVDANSIQVLQPILPYLVLVKNNTSTGLLAVAVRYERKDQSGKIVPAANSILLTTMNVRSRVIQPGEAVLLAPVGGLSRILRDRRGIPDQAGLSKVIAEKAIRYGGFSQIKVFLDTIVSEDGVVIGPDKCGLEGRLNAYLRAEETLRVDILGRKGSAVEEYLNSVLELPEKPVYTVEEIDWYGLHLRNTATILLSILHSAKSEGEFFSQIWSTLGSPIPPPHRR